jgi:hypothetical protein
MSAYMLPVSVAVDLTRCPITSESMAALQEDLFISTWDYIMTTYQDGIQYPAVPSEKPYGARLSATLTDPHSFILTFDIKFSEDTHAAHLSEEGHLLLRWTFYDMIAAHIWTQLDRRYAPSNVDSAEIVARYDVLKKHPAYLIALDIYEKFPTTNKDFIRETLAHATGLTLCTLADQVRARWIEWGKKDLDKFVALNSGDRTRYIEVFTRNPVHLSREYVAHCIKN